ncbi:MAG: ATPase domain-containing protein [Betaproteobacteria bacterium]
MKVSTGIKGLDEIVHGGLPADRSYLIVGSAGNGKTVLSMQWLLEGVRLGEKVAYVTLAEPASSLHFNAAGFGWDLAGVEIMDLTALGESFSEGEYRVFQSDEVERPDVWKSLFDFIKAERPVRIVIDSITHLRYLSSDPYQFRRHVRGLVSSLNKVGCTAYLLYEPSEFAFEASVGLAVDGILHLRRGISPGLATGVRSIEVEKLRGTDFLSGLHPLRISSSGMEIFPHRVEKTGSTRPGELIISSGIAAIDALLGGGLESGTTTMLCGPAGVGKSSLGTQFLIEGAKRGGRSVLFTFEESPESVLKRSRGISVPLAAHLESGAVKIVRVNPMELYPDEFLAMVRHAVEEEGFTSVMIDSLRGYEFAMEEFGMAKAHVHNLVTYLNRNAVTTVIVSEVEYITSADLRATDMGVSHLADTVVLMRYAEYEGRIVKIINCLKKRIGGFEPDIRLLTIDARGMAVGDKLDYLQGILSGAPTLTRQSP